jgi:hypothetical protein
MTLNHTEAKEQPRMFDTSLILHIVANKPVRIRILPGEPLWRTNTHVYRAGERAVERYFWRMVVRGQESEGPKILSVGKLVHAAIVQGIVENPVHPVLHWTQKVALWVSNRGLFGWKPLGFLQKWLPKPKDCLDEEVGYDFFIEKTMRQQGECEYPCYKSMRFIPVSCPAGSPEEIASWKEAGDVLQHLFLKGFNNGNETVKAGGA